MPQRDVRINKGVQMNWNPFKRAEPLQDVCGEMYVNLLSRVMLLEQQLMDIEDKAIGNSELQSKLDKEKIAYKRAYAREYYYRKKANKPTLKQIQMQARIKALEEQA